MHKQVEKTVLSPCMVPISGGEAVIPVWAKGCRLIAVTITSLLMGGLDLSQEHLEDGRKNTCVKFGVTPVGIVTNALCNLICTHIPVHFL